MQNKPTNAHEHHKHESSYLSYEVQIKKGRGGGGCGAGDCLHGRPNKNSNIVFLYRGNANEIMPT